MKKPKISDCPYYKNSRQCMNKHARKLFGAKCMRKNPFKCLIYVDFIERLESPTKEENKQPRTLQSFWERFKGRLVKKE